MFELVQAGANSYYINCPAKIGLYCLNEQEVVLFDSGSDKDAAKKVEKILKSNSWTCAGIINTHFHADHIGGNARLQADTGCPAYANKIEADLSRNPILEPAVIYGGCPDPDLRHKFLLAQESAVQDLSACPFLDKLEIIPLPGHSFDMIGIRTPDDVVYLADCVNSPATLEKYRIGVIYDVEAYLKTLDYLDTLTAALFVPAHAEAVNDIHPLVQANREAVWEIRDRILNLLSTPVTYEELLKALFDFYGLSMNFEQYALVGSTVRSYLTWLRNTAGLNVSFEENRMLWHAAGNAE